MGNSRKVGWLTQLRKLPGAVAQARRVVGGGGPTGLHLRGIEQPTGLFVPSSRLKLEVEARNGAKARWEPEVPLPFPYAWAYRIARWLHVPVISSKDPQDLTLSVTIPRGRSGRAHH